MQTLRQGVHCKAEYRPAVHGDGRGACAAGPARVDGGIAAGTQHHGKGRRVCRQFKDGGPGPVAEQHTGGAVGRVHQAGKGLAPDDEGVLPAQSGKQAPGHGGAVQKAGTGRVDVQRRAGLGQAQCRLYLTGHAGGRVRGREGGADAAGNVCRGKAAALQRLLCGGNGQCGGGFAFGAPVPGADASAGGDPVVAGVHHAAQIVVRDRPARQGPAGGK